MDRVSIFKIAVLLIFQFSAADGITQNTVGGRNAGGSDIKEGPGGTIQQINTRPNPIIKGSKYLNAEWQKGDIEDINGQKIEGVLIKYNVEDGNVELYQMDSTRKSIHDSRIKRVVIYAANSDINQILLNGTDFRIKEVPIIGLVSSEELVGKFNLITRYKIKKSDATYNPVLDAGTEETKIEIEPTIYLAENYNLTEFPNSKKKVARLFGDANTELIMTFIKSNNINVKQYRGLVHIVTYVNSLE